MTSLHEEDAHTCNLKPLLFLCGADDNNGLSFFEQVAGEALGTNFYGSLNMVRRIVPARWSDAMTGEWLPNKVHAGMREGGLLSQPRLKGVAGLQKLERIMMVMGA